MCVLRMPVQHYKWAYDLRGLDTVEKIEAATGLTMGVRNLSEEVSARAGALCSRSRCTWLRVL